MDIKYYYWYIGALPYNWFILRISLKPVLWNVFSGMNDCIILFNIKLIIVYVLKFSEWVNSYEICEILMLQKPIVQCYQL